MQSQLVLRPMDLEGRSLGTERPFTFTGGTSNNQLGALTSKAPAVGSDFAAVLADSTTLDGEVSVQSDVPAPMEEGLADAIVGTDSAGERQSEVWKPRSDDAVEPTDDLVPLELGEDAHLVQGGAGDAAHHSAEEAAGHESANHPRETSALISPSSLEEEAPLEPDASEALGLAGSNGVLPAEAGPIGSDLAQGASDELSTPQEHGSLASLQGFLQGGSRSAASGDQSEEPHQGVQAPGAAATSKAAPEVEASRSSEPPLDTRALLKEVRMQIVEGKREARIQLRPAELGRLDLLIGVDGKDVVVKVAAESAEALATLEVHARELRAWFAQDGAESVELKFSLIERGEMEFAHQGDDGQQAAFKNAAKRRNLAFAGESQDPEATANDLNGTLGGALEQRTQVSGVDFIA